MDDDAVADYLRLMEAMERAIRGANSYRGLWEMVHEICDRYGIEPLKED